MRAAERGFNCLTLQLFNPFNVLTNMHRFYLPPHECSATTLTLTGREAHHGLHVLRLRKGERVVVLDGQGGEYECEVKELNRSSISLSVQRKDQIAPLPYQIALLQAIPKGKLIEDIIQKATELGAHRVVPLITERVVKQLDKSNSAAKHEHWRLMAIEASKQCGSAWLPQIDPPIPLKTYLARAEQFDLALIGSLREDSRHPREWFDAFRAKHGHQPQSIAVFVGPEGDFTDAEIAAAKAAGARPITLGRLVLRCETAAIYCLSVVNHELQTRPVGERSLRLVIGDC